MGRGSFGVLNIKSNLAFVSNFLNHFDSVNKYRQTNSVKKIVGNMNCTKNAELGEATETRRLEYDMTPLSSQVGGVIAMDESI
jgi:hypothetical protein